MEFVEQWEHWMPINNLSKKYYIDYILSDSKIFKIILTDINNVKNKVHVVFEDSIHAFKWVDEIYRFKKIEQLNKQFGTNFCEEWTFFKVTNSDYLKWISDQSYGISDDRDLIHFSFIGANSILDVIDIDPKVEIIEET